MKNLRCNLPDFPYTTVVVSETLECRTGRHRCWAHGFFVSLFTFLFFLYLNGFVPLVLSVLELNRSPKNSNPLNTAGGVWSVSVQISSKDRRPVLRYSAAHNRAIWTHRDATFSNASFYEFPVAICRQQIFRNTTANRNSIRNDYLEFVERKKLSIVSLLFAPDEGCYRHFYDLHGIADVILAPHDDPQNSFHAVRISDTFYRESFRFRIVRAVLDNGNVSRRIVFAVVIGQVHRSTLLKPLKPDVVVFVRLRGV